jgi:pimeloyl-ACP methyl ester carboxylesterase
MGAATALVMAGTFPDVPGAILLEDPPSWWLGGPEPAHAAERRARMRERFIEQRKLTREALLAAERGEHPGWSEAELQPWADAKLRYSPNVAQILNSDNATGVDWPAVLARITCPALLITADPERGAIVTTKSAEALRALVPHLRIAHVTEAGHSVRRDQLAPYLDVVRAFLAEWATTRETERGRGASSPAAAARS